MIPVRGRGGGPAGRRVICGCRIRARRARPPGGLASGLRPAVAPALLRDGRIPQARGLHLRGSARLFTAEVRPVIAGMENSFLSPVFIYTLIKEPSLTSEWQRVAAAGLGLGPGSQSRGGCAPRGRPRRRPSARGGPGDKGARSWGTGTSGAHHPGRVQWFCGWISPLHC